MKSYFLKKRIITNLFIALLLATMLSFKFFLIVFVLATLVLYIYRKRALPYISNKDIELNSIFSPITGRVKGISKKEGKCFINIAPRIVGPLGIYMPFSGSVDDCEDNNVLLYNKLGHKLSLSFSRGLFNDSNIWLNSGDLANYSANVGFLGFGGSIIIELKDDSKILIEKGQKVFAGQSIIAGFEVSNE